MARIILAGTDGPSIAVLAAELEAEGHEVVKASDGYDAYGLASTADLVFIEMDLPVYSGFDLCAMLRSDPDMPPGLPLVLFTDENLDPRRMERARATCRFPKTHGTGDLRDLLAALLGEKARA
ncbi:MAG TPA: response regulator [Candidatus Hydrogenedentes bacterium]|nr:response regulator [Candidatus Hydrogenedentota bacterium]HNT87528.1 response regulator [Candidatus Hydrogenedentota bacterium]